MIDTAALKTKILALAFQGRLTEQTSENARELFVNVCEERDLLIKKKIIKKNKTKSITSDELKFEIPSNWIWVRLGDVINLQSGQDLTTSDYNDKVQGVPYITGASNFRTDESFIINRWTETPKAIALEDDILLSVKGTVGKIAFLHEKKVHIARQIMGIRPIGLYRKYVKYFVQEQVEELKAISKGLIPGIERDNVLNMLMPMPPLCEQEIIVEKIEEAFKQLDTIDELQSQYSSDLEVLKSKIIDAGIQGQLSEQLSEDGTAEELLKQIAEEKKQRIKEKKLKVTKALPDITEDEIPFEIPDTWKYVRIGDVCELNPKNDLSDNLDVSFIPMACVTEGYNNKHSCEIKKWGDIKKGFNHFQNDDIGVAKITPCFQNRKSVVFRDLLEGYGAGTTELSIVRGYEGMICPDYLLWFFKSAYFINNGIESFTGVVGQQRIHKDYLKMCVLPLPPYSEQLRIADKINSAIATVENM